MYLDGIFEFGEIMKNWLKKITGIEKLEKEREALQAARDKAVAETVRAQEEAELAKLGPKERATARGEPYIAVLDTKVNPDNIRNGFFELDWNDQFVLQLKQEGYGFDGDAEEEIVDRWFRDIVKQMLEEDGLDVNRPAGYINVVPIAKGKSEVS
jgi:hypothetical protein